MRPRKRLGSRQDRCRGYTCCFGKTPPELAADISDRGIVLTGGGALLHGLEQLIEEKTGITTVTAEDPMSVVAVGTGKYIDFLAEQEES